MKKEIQAKRVFKYYRLPKWKVVELCGTLGTCDYRETDSQGRR